MLARRSTLAVVLGLTWFLAPPCAAQSTATTLRVGFVSNNTNANFEAAVLGPMRKEFARLGYVDGQNISYDFRHVGGDLARHPELAADLVRSNVDLIVTAGGPASAAASKATSRIPIIFIIVADPVAIKLVDSMQRPGRNLTGITNDDPELAPRQLALLKEALPQLARVAILSEEGLPGADDSGLIPIERTHVAAAKSLGLQAQLVRLKGPTPDLVAAFAAMVKERADAVIVLEVPLALSSGGRIAEQAAAQRLPSLFPGSLPAAGGLFSYGTNVFDNFAYIPAMADRIFKGTPASEIPVVVNARRRLVANLRTAQQLGLTVPEAVLQRADQVIR